MALAVSTQGYSYEELEGSPSGSTKIDGATAKRMFKIAWADRDGFINELLGIGRDIAGTVEFTGPLRFPGNRVNMVVDAVAWEPFDPSKPSGSTLGALDADANTYDNGLLITASYKEQFDDQAGSGGSPTIGVPGGRVSYQVVGGVEYATNANQDWVWADNTSKLPGGQHPGIIIPTNHHKITWSRCVRPPFTAIKAKVGTINSADFLGCFTKTLLFVNYEARAEFGAGVEFPSWQLTYDFAERNVTTSHYGWNHVFNGNTGVWEEPRPSGDNAKRMYVDTLFDSLLVYE